jgi:hypothetical protein
MREIEQEQRTDKQYLNVNSSKSIQQVLVLIDNLIAGKRFAELDSTKQMCLLNCQVRIDAIQKGVCTEGDIIFLIQTIDSLTKTLFTAKDELENLLY